MKTLRNLFMVFCKRLPNLWLAADFQTKDSAVVIVRCPVTNDAKLAPVMKEFIESAYNHDVQVKKQGGALEVKEPWLEQSQLVPPSGQLWMFDRRVSIAGLSSRGSSVTQMNR